MNETSPKLGFCASVVAFIAAAAYGLAQIAQILNIVSYPLADILIYGTSLCISAPFLIAILALHDTVESRKRIWTTGALLFGVVYMTYVVLMYAVQLSVVIPKSMESPSGSVLDVAPQTLFWTIDGLGYVSMGVSTLLQRCRCRRRGQGCGRGASCSRMPRSPRSSHSFISIRIFRWAFFSLARPGW